MNKLTKIILIIIPALLLLIFLLTGRNFDNDYFLPKINVVQNGITLPEKIDGWFSANLKWFPEENMFEKINGKAAFYRQIGVDGLLAGDWIKNGKTWAMFLFKMKNANAAKQAFLSERPDKFSEMNIGGAAYFLSGALVLRAGDLYIQFSADNPEENPMSITGLAVKIAAGFLAEESDNIFTFAKKYSVPNSENFIADEAFGFTSLKNVQTFLCVAAGTTAQWIAIENGAEILNDYKKELQKYGCEHFFELENAAGGNMFGEWEIGGKIGNDFFGVREAVNKKQLLQHWQKIKQKVH